MQHKSPWMNWSDFQWNRLKMWEVVDIENVSDIPIRSYSNISCSIITTDIWNYRLKEKQTADSCHPIQTSKYNNWFWDRALCKILMEQHALKNLNNCLNTNIYSYLETSGGQSSNLYLHVVPFLTPVLTRNLWQLKTVVFLHWCLICAVLLLGL
jgi:hypothetical protein